ncbi:hypothetical protein E5259_19125 [Blautia producta]|uniref:Uncharacterized protein n=1 Tax=Blautia producta TaxID=33035 RepID=A0A7G5MY56_9FIRM|nr:hypothetical protein [Blautia producta]QMW79549.1 hypothetical protein E5259_19125 [Blautia producta]
MKYAKRICKRKIEQDQGNIDLTGVLEGVTIQVINNTNVDGTPLRETMADYTIRKKSERDNGELGRQEVRDVSKMKNYEISFNGDTGGNHGVFLYDIPDITQAKAQLQFI